MNALAAWRSLLWKDFYQVRPALLGCLAMLAAIQLLYLVMQLLAPGGDMSLFRDAYVIALLAPSFSAIACAGLLIGHERQTRSWNWSSSLPIDWRAALASKFCVWLVSSLSMLVLLMISYAALYGLAWGAGRAPNWAGIEMSVEWRHAIVMMLLIPLEGFVVFCLASLLWNDTLLALVGAAIVVLVVQTFISLGAVPLFFGGSPNVRVNTAAYFLITLVLTLGWTLLAAMALAALFEWRWTSGQLESMSIVRKRALAESSVSDQQAAWTLFAKRSRRPSELMMMLDHGWRSAASLRVAILILAIVCTAMSSTRPGLLLSLGAAWLLLGITTFAGDRTLGRDRFFADRGASWMRLLVAHMLPAFVAAIVLGIVAAWVMASTPQIRQFSIPAGFAVLLVAFAIGVFSSLCTSSTIIAVTVGSAILLLGIASFAAVDSFWTFWAGEPGYVLLGLPVSLAILAAGILFQMRRNLVFDRPSTLPVLVTVVTSAIALPLLLCASLAFLRVPLVPWHGVSESQARELPQVMLPALNIETPYTQPGLIPPPSPINAVDYYERLASHVSDYYQRLTLHVSDYLQIRETIRDTVGIRKWLDEWAEAIDSLRSEIEDRDSYAPANYGRLADFSRLIESSALAATIATRERRGELAVAAWKLNRELLQITEQNTEVAKDTLTARINTYRLWTFLTAEDIDLLKQHAAVDQLLPTPVPEHLWELALKKQWTARKTLLEGNTPPLATRMALRAVPPLRWYFERALAVQLEDELATFKLPGQAAMVGRLGPQPHQYSVVWMHDPLYFQLLMLHDLQQAVRPRLEPSPE